MFQIPKDVLDKVKLLNQPWVSWPKTGDVNYPTTPLPHGPVDYSELFEKNTKKIADSMAIPQDIIDAAEAIQPIQGDHLGKMYQQYQAANIKAVADAFMVPGLASTVDPATTVQEFNLQDVKSIVEEFQRKQRRAEAKRQIRRMTAKASMEFSMEYLPIGS